jgi:hypothetical protein
MEVLASASSGGVSAGRAFAGPRRGDWMASAGEAVPDVTAAWFLRSDSLGLLSRSVFKGAEPGLRFAILRPARGGRPGLFQPAVVGVGEGDGAAGDADQAGAAAAGLVSASAVVVTGPAELPFSQADQDSCQ